MDNYIEEAFKEVKGLNEDFDLATVNVPEFKGAIMELIGDDDTDYETDEIVYDIDAGDDEEAVENKHVGNIVIECNCCHTRFYKEKEDVTYDVEEGCVNKDDECPICGGDCGYTVIGKIEGVDMAELGAEEEDGDDEATLEDDDINIGDDEFDDSDLATSDEDVDFVSEPFDDEMADGKEDSEDDEEDEDEEESEDDKETNESFKLPDISSKDRKTLTEGKKPESTTVNGVQYNGPASIVKVLLLANGKDDLVNTIDRDLAVEMTSDESKHCVIDNINGVNTLYIYKDAKMSNDLIDEISEAVDEFESTNSEELDTNPEGKPKITEGRIFDKDAIAQWRDSKNPKQVNDEEGLLEFLEKIKPITYGLDMDRLIHDLKEELGVSEQEPKAAEEIDPEQDVDLDDWDAEWDDEDTELESLNKSKMASDDSKKLDESVDFDASGEENVHMSKGDDGSINITVGGGQPENDFIGQEESYDETPATGDEMITPLRDEEITEIENGDNIPQEEPDVNGAEINDMEPAGSEEQVMDDQEDIALGQEGEGSLNDILDDLPANESWDISEMSNLRENKQRVKLNSEEFDSLGESFFKKVYENVDKFYTTNVKSTEEQMIIEGLVKFKSGVIKENKFVLDNKGVSPTGIAVFEGNNNIITRRRSAFRLSGKLVEGVLNPRRLSYNYRTKSDGKHYVVRGKVVL